MAKWKWQSGLCSCVCLCVRMCMRRQPFTLHLWCVLPLWGMHAVALWTSTLAAAAVAKQLQTGCSHGRLPLTHSHTKTHSHLSVFLCLHFFSFRLVREHDRTWMSRSGWWRRPGSSRRCLNLLICWDAEGQMVPSLQVIKEARDVHADVHADVQEQRDVLRPGGS